MPGNYRNEEGTSIDNVRTTGDGFVDDQKMLGTNFNEDFMDFPELVDT